MVSVGESVRLALKLYTDEEDEAALLFACLAVDGTAKKARPASEGNRQRFAGFIRNSYWLFGPFAMPGIDTNTMFPVTLDGKKQEFDVADLVYKVHRCTHGHGDELPQGFELIPDSRGPDRFTTLEGDLAGGSVRISDRTIFGLIAIAVASPTNADQQAAPGDYLTFDGRFRFDINDHWGQRGAFEDALAQVILPSILLNLGDTQGEASTPA